MQFTKLVRDFIFNRSWLTLAWGEQRCSASYWLNKLLIESQEGDGPIRHSTALIGPALIATSSRTINPSTPAKCLSSLHVGDPDDSVTPHVVKKNSAGRIGLLYIHY